ncbi:hypothetical protein [Streptomyces sp. NPDC058335]
MVVESAVEFPLHEAGDVRVEQDQVRAVESTARKPAGNGARRCSSHS